jgi:hypothetical protein
MREPETLEGGKCLRLEDFIATGAVIIASIGAIINLSASRITDFDKKETGGIRYSEADIYTLELNEDLDKDVTSVTDYTNQKIYIVMFDGDTIIFTPSTLASSQLSSQSTP